MLSDTLNLTGKKLSGTDMAYCGQPVYPCFSINFYIHGCVAYYTQTTQTCTDGLSQRTKDVRNLPGYGYELPRTLISRSPDTCKMLAWSNDTDMIVAQMGFRPWLLKRTAPIKSTFTPIASEVLKWLHFHVHALYSQHQCTWWVSFEPFRRWMKNRALW